MEDLKFPIFKGKAPKDRILSMDEYLKFVQFHLKYTFNREAYLKWKEIIAVDKPFKL